MPPANWLTGIGVSIGTVCGVTCAALCVLFVFANPYAPMSIHEAGVWVAIVPCLGAGGALAALAAVRRQPRALLILFLLSFVPFGLYLSLTIPRIFGWIGASHLGYLVASLVLRASAAPHD